MYYIVMHMVQVDISVAVIELEVAVTACSEKEAGGFEEVDQKGL